MSGDTPRDEKGYSRRQVLSGAAAVVILGVPALADAANRRHTHVKGRKRWPKPPGVHKPRFHKKKKNHKPLITSLAPGFYKNPKTQVIHYVQAGGKICGVHQINEKRLQPMKIADVVKLATAGDPHVAAWGDSHVHLSCASHVLEQAALASLEARDVDNACLLLLAAIRHDKLYKRGPLDSPSLRLYDLLAGLTHKHARQPHFAALVRLTQSGAVSRPLRPRRRRRLRRLPPRIPPKALHAMREHRRWKKERKRLARQARATKLATAFNRRRQKWTVPNNNWHKRWADVSKPLPWKVHRM